VAQPVFKLLAPPSLAAAIAGQGAATESATGVAVEVTDKGDFYPGTGSQVVTLRSLLPSSGMLDAIRHVLTQLPECGECAADDGDGHKITAVLPSKSVSAVIGEAGSNVQALQRSTGARVRVERSSLGSGPGGDRTVDVCGAAPAIEAALGRVLECVQEFVDHPWFPAWAQRTNQERVSSAPASFGSS